MGQQVINGLFLGSIYALFALGYTLVFGVLDILNLAHAAVFMLACFVALVLVARLHLHILVGPAAGRAVRRPARRRAGARRLPPASRPDRLQHLRPHQLARHGHHLRGGGPADLGPERLPLSHRHPSGPADPDPAAASCPQLQLGIIAVAVLLFLALTWLVQRTRLGREVRAVAESPRAARILGVDVDRAIAASFFISSALGGAAGVLFGLAFNSISPDMGRSVELKGLAVIILGGMGSMPGAVIAGFALGLIEVFVVAYLGLVLAGRHRPSPALFLILVLRPRGLLGAAAIREA